MFATCGSTYTAFRLGNWGVLVKRFENFFLFNAYRKSLKIIYRYISKIYVFFKIEDYEIELMVYYMML